MSSRAMAAIGLAGIIVLACIRLSAPPSDDDVIAQFQAHRETFAAVVALYQADQRPLMAAASGRTWPADGSEALAAERLAAYQSLLREAGAARSAGISPEGQVSFYLDPPLLLPGVRARSLVYAPQPPPRLTAEDTDAYTFRRGEYRLVCRSIEAPWYICRDDED